MKIMMKAMNLAIQYLSEEDIIQSIKDAVDNYNKIDNVEVKKAHKQAVIMWCTCLLAKNAGVDDIEKHIDSREEMEKLINLIKQ